MTREPNCRVLLLCCVVLCSVIQHAIPTKRDYHGRVDTVRKNVLDHATCSMYRLKGRKYNPTMNGCKKLFLSELQNGVCLSLSHIQATPLEI